MISLARFCRTLNIPQFTKFKLETFQDISALSNIKMIQAKTRYFVHQKD